MTDDSLWEDSYDTPCVHCGNTPCYTLCNGDAFCDRCWKGFSRLLADMEEMMAGTLDRKKKNAGLA